MTSYSEDDSIDIETQSVTSAFNLFLTKLKNDDWLSNSSKEEIKNCIHSARKIETMSNALESKDCLESFASMTTNVFGFDANQLKNICDVVLSMVLTAPGVPLSRVRVCIDEYFQLCGSDRFQCVLSSVIFCSEIYRVLLDYLASSECSQEHAQIHLQSNLFSRIWKTETDIDKLKPIFSDWLHADSYGQNVGVALMVICSEDSSSSTKLSLVHLLTKVLSEREDMAILFWKTLIQLPQTRKALEKSMELLSSTMEFLNITAQWMEATPTFMWVSREKGPCNAFGYVNLVSAVKLLLETEGIVSEKAKQFLFKKKNSIGCTLWDDIQMELKH